MKMIAATTTANKQAISSLDWLKTAMYIHARNHQC